MTDLEILRADLASARLPRPQARIALLAAGAAVTTTAAAFAANHYLGQPAPAHVNATFASINDRGSALPAVKLATARVVALSQHAVLFGADAADGSYCTELVTHGGSTYYMDCRELRSPASLRLYPPFVFNGNPFAPPPYIVAGRTSQRAARLDARLPNGTVERVPIGIHGAFVFEAKHQAAVRAGDVTLVERDGGGSITSRVKIPPQVVVAESGWPIHKVAGLVTARRARYVAVEVWVQRGTGPRREIVQSGEAKVLPLVNGRFSWTVTPQKKKWYVSLTVMTARYFPLSDATTNLSMAPPDFWARIRAEATRNGV